MKRIALYLAACFVVCCSSAQAKHDVKVIGLVNLRDWKVAWLEMADSPPNNSFRVTERVFVSEGQSFDDKQVKDAHVHTEILEIDVTKGIVRAKEDGRDTVYEFKGSVETETIPPQTTVRLDNIGLGGVLDFYAEASGRTLLVHPAIHQTNFSVLLHARDKVDAMRLLEKNLREKGIASIPDGEKFEMIVPVALEKTIQSNLGDSPLQKAATQTPGYNYNLQGVDLNQILEMYGALVGKKLAQDKPLPSFPFAFRTQTALTRSETLHAFDTLFAWHGIKAVNVDDKSFKIAPISSAE